MWKLEKMGLQGWQRAVWMLRFSPLCCPCNGYGLCIRQCLKN